MPASDLFAATGAAALAMLALLHGMVWRAQRQRWAALFTLGMALGAVFYAADPWLRPSGDQANPLGSVLGALVIFLLLGAMADFVGVPARVARWLVPAGIGFGVVLLALRLAGWVPRSVGFAAYAAFFALFAALAAWGMRREPGRGHGVVLASLLTYPATVVLMLLGHVPQDLVRYVIIVPSVMLGMTVLTTGQMRLHAAARLELQRRQAAEAELRRLNDSLEQRVAGRTAELSAMVTALESFNRSVSHDLRGPLGGMAHALQLAQQALEAGEIDTVRRVLPVVATQAGHSAELVSALLALAHAGSGALQRRSLDSRRVVDEALAQLRASRGGTDATPLPVQVQPSLPLVLADAGLLRQVFVNLLGNALKFSAGAAAPQVEVGAHLQGAEVVFHVRDNGVGFDALAARRLFEPFERLHGGRFEGTGVGLSIVHRIVERHGGRLWAESTPGAGASFFFTLPSNGSAAVT